MSENKESLLSQVKWLVGIFGILFLSSIWHVAVISTDVQAVKDEQKDKVDNVVLQQYIYTIEKSRNQEREFFLDALKEQKITNKEFTKAVKNLEIAIETMKTCN